MGKKVRFFVFVTCCLVVCWMLGGCGQKEELSLEAPAVAEEPAEIVPAETPMEETEEDPSEFLAMIAAMADEELDTLLSDDSLTDAEFDAVIAEIDARTAAKVETDSELHGIIALVGTYGGWDGSKETFDIISINPESGEINTVSSFSVPLYTFEVNGEPQNYLLTDVNSLFGNYRDMFSSDFDKLAVTVFYKSGEMHAGWLDKSNSFVDMTAALTPKSQSDFYDLPRHVAVRFDGEDLVYSDNANNEVNLLKISTDLSADTITEYVSPQTIGRIDFNDIMPTDWIDNSNCLVTYYTSTQAYCEKCNTSTRQLSSFIPETSRCNWSGVLSPNGETVAFLSMPSNTSGDAEIFTIPLAGGDPTKLNLRSSLRSMYGDISMERQHGTQAEVYCYLLDWVE